MSSLTLFCRFTDFFYDKLGENVPKHLGLPLAAKSPSYYMLEVHFDNPSMKKVVDTSGLRLHYTHKLRPNEGGFLVAGVTISPLHLVPPRQAEYKSGGYCSMECTREVVFCLRHPRADVISLQPFRYCRFCPGTE